MSIYMKIRKMSWLESVEIGYDTEVVLKNSTANKWSHACKTALRFPTCPLFLFSCTVEELGLGSALRSDLICADMSQILTTLGNND